MKFPKLGIVVFALAIVAGGLALGVKRLPPGFWLYLREEGTLVLRQEACVARLQADRRLAMVTMRKGMEACAPDQFLPAWGRWTHLIVIEGVDVLGHVEYPHSPEWDAYLEAQGHDEVDSMFEAYSGCVAERTTPAELG